MSGTEIEYDPETGVLIVNEADVAFEDIQEFIRDRGSVNRLPEIAAVNRWANSTRRSSNLFLRDKYVPSDNVFEKMRTAANAARTDDIVSNAVETTEQLAFKRIAIETEDPDEQSVWNQLADDLDLSERCREGWRELFIVSQAYPAVVFGDKTYTVNESPSRGEKRRKRTFKIQAPLAISFLDPCKVVPVGNFAFGQEQLVYIADKDEDESFNTLAGPNSSDLIVSQLIKGKYTPKKEESQLLEQLIPNREMRQNLWVLNPDNVWRMTATRPSYQRFADVRMESVFELLDLKHLLREMDRAAILGNTNAIVLVKKGDKDRPAQAGEMEELATRVGGGSRNPVIVSDHRLEIEIITPKTDKTLAAERYNGLDSRIMSRLYQSLSTGAYSSGTQADDSIKLLKVIASTMEARRDKIRDSIMTHVFRVTWQKNRNLIDEPKMQFYPRRIALDFDPNIAVFMQDLRDRGDISRETILAELDILENDEFIKRLREAEAYDHAFTPTTVPFDGPAPGGENQDGPSNPKAAGRTGGGNRNGGGRNPDSTRPNSSPRGS